MTFSPLHYSRLKKRLENKYSRSYLQLKSSLKKFPPSRIGQWLLLHHTELISYSPVKWYLLKQIQTFLWFNQQQDSLSDAVDDFFEIDDEVFERWNKSEFAGDFLKALNKGNSVRKASAQALKVFDEHLITLADRQILRLKKFHPSYRVQTSLGEILKNKKPTRLLETTLHLEGKELNLMTHSMKEMKAFSHRIEIALKVIRKFSPDSWERFKAFTDVIIPIGEPEFVSYSQQELPAYSMINLYHRDFVDLMDDLLHENGHHHLNYYLNLGKLIDEPIDCIYYSPWRRTLRPVRGIYHAFFTFFWAFKLFSDLANADEQDSEFYFFSKQEKEKIYWRAIEEYLMLNFTFEDLKWARRKGLIADAGWELVQEQKKILNRFNRKISLWEKKIGSHKKELKDLKRVLEQGRKKYKKT